MEIVRLNVKKDRIIHCKNPFGEEYNDYLYKNDYIFEVGKTYGVICEHGEGGESLSLLLSSEKELVSEEILIDNGCLSSVEEIGWYVGKSIYSNSILNKEITQKKSIEMAIHKYRRYDNISDIINDFHLSDNKLDYSFKVITTFHVCVSEINSLKGSISINDNNENILYIAIGGLGIEFLQYKL